MEAWLYQNTEMAKEMCRMYHQGHSVKNFDNWKSNRGALDEIEQIKDNVCLKNGFNLELSGEGYPAQAVYDVKKSFHEAVEEFKKNPQLVESLAKTRRP